MRLAVTLLLILGFIATSAGTMRGLGTDEGSFWLLGSLILGVATIVAMLWWMAAALRGAVFSAREQQRRLGFGPGRLTPHDYR